MTEAGAGRSEAERIATAVLGVPEVAAMSAGPVGQFRSYLPGASVPGVRVDDDQFTINVVAYYGPALSELGQHVLDALGPLLGGRTVSLCVDDIVLPGEQPPTGAGSVVERDEPGPVGRVG